MTDIRRCALITRFADTRVAESAALIARHLASRGLEALASEDERDRLQGVEARFLSESALIREADLIIAIGGDGTLLYAAGLVAEHGTPLLGVNRGRLGFLTDVMPEDMLSAVDAALAGQCLRDERPLLRAEIKSAAGSTVSGLALNDVVLQKRQSGHLIDFETWIDGHFVNSHGGDGLVVASATGSTAYALSCGGPIVDPSLEIVVVTPICPHTLSDRPIVVSARSAIEIRIIDRPDSSAEVACDGRSLAPLNPGESLVIRTAGARITLLHPEGYDYYRLLRSKLNWGRRSFDAQR
ncbi:MAG: NAD(+) kinase [Gammaproteobacteria bacterium]|nr:NAD(+) kinase [Gammaproteobacteria bacterium]